MVYYAMHKKGSTLSVSMKKDKTEPRIVYRYVLKTVRLQSFRRFVGLLKILLGSLRWRFAVEMLFHSLFIGFFYESIKVNSILYSMVKIHGNYRAMK
jgi:hypothetical protein